MGYGYNLRCNNCGYSINAFFGNGFRYPLLCEKTLAKIKSGTFGKRFMNDALAHPNAAVNQKSVLFICDNCGELKSADLINLCVPVSETFEQKVPLCSKANYMSSVSYVMDYSIGKTYTILRSKQHRCGKCRHAMRPVEDEEKLKCPHCGKLLDLTDYMYWD